MLWYTQKVQGPIPHSPYRAPSVAMTDFGKSVPFSNAKNSTPKQAHLKEQYINSYNAPELVNGTRKPSIQSDIYPSRSKLLMQFWNLEIQLLLSVLCG